MKVEVLLPFKFQARVVIGIEIVDANDKVAAFFEKEREMSANKTCSSCNEDPFSHQKKSNLLSFGR